jgi:hypothetical protein
MRQVLRQEEIAMHDVRPKQVSPVDLGNSEPQKSRYDSGNKWSVPAEVRKINGEWKAIRLDGKSRWSDRLFPAPPNQVGFPDQVD